MYLLSNFLLSQTGIPVSEMNDCDNLTKYFMNKHSIPGGTFALAKNGKLIYMRAFGTSNNNGNIKTQPYNLFRIASISKPITAVAIMKLVENDSISLTDKVFGVGGLLENHTQLSNVNITDSRIYDITVQHLLEHSAGWNRDLNCFPDPTTPYPWHFDGCDPIVAPLHVTSKLGYQNPGTEENFIQFLLEKGLDFSPGTNYAYSNIGYSILGEIIEIISDKNYENYVTSEIFHPLGIFDTHLGKNLLVDKMEREVEYKGDGYITLSCYGTGDYVPWEYGGHNLEAMGSHGGWVSTSRDLVKLLVSIDGFKTKPDILNSSIIEQMVAPSANNQYYAKGWQVNAANNWWHTGAFSGTSSFFGRTHDGYTWAILLNKRGIKGDFWANFDNLPWDCITSAKTFPSHDLMEFPSENSSNISFSNISHNSATIHWKKGDGTNRILIAKENNQIDHFPLDGVSYKGNLIFGNGDNLGNDCYVLYNGINDSVTVSGLSSKTKYYFRVFEYNQSSITGGFPLYMLGNSENRVVDTHSLSIPIGVDIPRLFSLSQNYPNPFNPTTSLRFDLPEVTDVTVTIFNMLGQKIKTFNMNDTPAGYHSIKWDATNDYGDPVGAGVYLFQLRANEFVKTRKMVLLK